MTISDFVSSLQQNRDAAYEKGEINPEFVANFAADVLLPTDLIYTINKAGRGEKVTAEDVALSAVDVVSTALGAISFGAGKVAGAAAKGAIKGGGTAAKIVSKSAGVGGIAAGAGGSIAVSNYYAQQGGNIPSDGTRDTEPDKQTDLGTSPNVTVNVIRQVQTKVSDNTDTQGLNDLALALVLSQQARQPTTQPKQQKPQEKQTDKLPYLIVGGALLLLVILAVMRK